MKTFREYLAEAKVEKEVDLNEAIQIKSKVSALYFIKECADLAKDANIKNKLHAVLEFLSKEFKLPIDDEED